PFMSGECLSLLLYIIIQRTRTTYSVDEFNELNDKLIKNIMKPTIEDMKLSKEEVDSVKITVKNAQQILLGLGIQHHPLLLDLKWKLLKAAPPFEFITSDNPVVFYNQIMNFRNFGSNTGFSAKGLQIFFPISPLHLIILYDDKVYGVGSQKQKEILVDKKNDIDQLNNLQYVSAYENIYFYSIKFEALKGFFNAEKFRNHEKTSLKTLFKSENDETTNEFIVTSKNDIRTNLELSFIRILKPAKEWRRIFQKQKAQPMAVARNENLLNDHKEFLKLVESKKYTASEFFEYLNEKQNG
ncbi:MAG TPA: DUF4238 domain-containing protein, partial [bacterium]|nr:DUF4238 domain-containing protein [bacterium]